MRRRMARAAKGLAGAVGAGLSTVADDGVEDVGNRLRSGQVETVHRVLLAGAARDTWPRALAYLGDGHTEGRLRLVFLTAITLHTSDSSLHTRCQMECRDWQGQLSILTG